MASPRKQTDTCRYYIDNNFIRDGYGKELGPYAIAVYNAIAVHANQDQEAWPSHGTIANLTGMSARQVIREIEKLSVYNIVSVVSRAAERKPALITLLDKSEWKPIEHTTGSHMLDDEHTTDSHMTDGLKTDSHMTYDRQSYEHTTDSHTNRTNKTELKNNTLISSEIKGGEPPPTSSEIVDSPSDYSIAEIKECKFTESQYKAILVIEQKSDKPRSGLIKLIKTRLTENHPAWQMYRRKSEYYQVTTEWREEIVKQVGDKKDDVERWGEVVTDWCGISQNKGNIKKMLYYFNLNILPSQDNPFAKNGANYGHKQTHSSGTSSSGRTGVDLDKEPVYDPYTGETIYPT